MMVIETSPNFMFRKGDRILIAANVALDAAPRDPIVFADVNGRPFNVDRNAVVGAMWLTLHMGDEAETDEGEPIGLILAVTERWVVAQYGDEMPKAYVRFSVRPVRPQYAEDVA